MSVASLLALDLGLVIAGSALWFAAAVVAWIDTGRTRRTELSLTLAVAALLALAVRVGVDLLLADAGWWFASEKLLLALPVAVLTAALAGVVAGPELLRRIRRPPTREGRANTTAALVGAGLGSAVGLATTLVVGHAVTAVAAVTLVALVALLTALTWAALSRRVRFVAVVAALGLLTLAGAGAYTGAATAEGVARAAASGGHGPEAAPPGRDAVRASELRTPAAVSGEVVRFRLEARRQAITTASGATVHTGTFGGLPGPPLTARQGDVVEIELRNQDIPEGVTLRWHGYPVPNGEAGITGVTQDAVPAGESFTYRFLAEETGTYWYHAENRSLPDVSRGLYGTLVVLPGAPTEDIDLALPVGTVGDTTLLGPSDRVWRQPAVTGQSLRLRLVNTDPVTHGIRVLGAPFRVVAIDGSDLNEPGELEQTELRLPPGGRYDVVLTVPANPVSVRVVGTDAGFDLAAPDSPAARLPAEGWPRLDPFSYGQPAEAGPGTAADVTATVVLDRAVRILDGLPSYAYTVNGATGPLVPAIRVAEGDLVRLTIVNRTAASQPVHLPGHRALLLARNGREPSGSPLWVDSLAVRPGEVWELVFRADNPGIWVDRWASSEPAGRGMHLHLAYEGVVALRAVD